MWGTILNAVFGKVIPSAADFFTKKEELRQQVELERLRGKIAWEQALSQRASESEGRDHEWEMARIRAAGGMDNWVLALFSIPMIMSFIPRLAPYVVKGFEALDQTPDWYQFTSLLIFTAVFGIRIWRRK